jgi:AraC family transcriptional regulator
MFESPDILAIAHKQPVMVEELDVMQERDKQIPGTWQYTIRRYRKNPHWVMEDTGLLVYHFQESNPDQRHIELKFCLAGNTYCQQKDMDCDLCRQAGSKNCEHKIPSIDVLQFRFEPVHLSHFVKGHKKKSKSDELLNFRHSESFTSVVPLSNKIRMTLEALLNNVYTDSLENIFINAQTQILLLYTLESMFSAKEEEEEVPACKFLANESDREKIIKAREILIQHIGDPITIKELSRKVAINECYLKKGFKVLFGSTIFDFYQDQRMEHAKFLLYEKGRSVSEVSASLGYSSISHFSTAFKKHTGLKPCELLVK